MSADRQIDAPAPHQSTYKVRASSWGRLFDCAYAWEGVHLLGMNMPSGLRAQLGTAVHASTAAFDRGRLPGATPVEVEEAAELAVKELHDPDREVDYSRDDMSIREATAIALKLHTLYCLDLSPRYEFLSVEQTLKPMHIDCGGGIVVSLTGQMDRARVVNTNTGVVIPDVKTGRAVISRGQVQTKGRSAQLGTYQLLYEHTEGIPTVGGQILALSTNSRPEAGVSPVWDAKRVMVGSDKAPGLIEVAAGMFRSGLFPPNPTSPLCSERYCARWSRCHFHE